MGDDPHAGPDPGAPLDEQPAIPLAYLPLLAAGLDFPDVFALVELRERWRGWRDLLAWDGDDAAWLRLDFAAWCVERGVIGEWPTRDEENEEVA